jgi:hypothetical protein
VAWTASGNTQAVWGSQVIFTTQRYKREVPRYRKWKRINQRRANIEALAEIINTTKKF